MSSRENNSVDALTNALILKLNRKNIFPPIFNFSKIINSKKIDEQKRTPNAFFICRMNVIKEVERVEIKINMRVISKVTGILWNNASNEEKNEYLQLAENIKCHYLKSYSLNKQDQFNHYNVFQLSKETKEENKSNQNSLNDYNINSSNKLLLESNNNNNIEESENSFIQNNEIYFNNLNYDYNEINNNIDINEFYYEYNNYYFQSTKEETVLDSEHIENDVNFNEYLYFDSI